MISQEGKQINRKGFQPSDLYEMLVMMMSTRENILYGINGMSKVYANFLDKKGHSRKFVMFELR